MGAGMNIRKIKSSFSETEVIREAMKQLHAKGFETRFAVQVREVTEQVTA